MKVVSLINFKGGCGKTTMTCILALYLAEKEGKTVAVRDLDKSGSSKAFVLNQENERIKIFDGKNYDYLLVDTPGGIAEDELEEIIGLSDLVIVPMSLSPTDIRSTKSTITAIPESDKIKILFNKVNSQTSAFKSRGMIGETIGVRTFKTYIKDRVAYSYALVDGLSALNRFALEEMKNLTKEVENA